MVLGTNTSSALRKNSIPLPCPCTSPTMRNGLGEVRSQSHGSFSFLSALLALLLLTPSLTMVSGVRAMCGGSLVAPRPGEARVMCPLTKDVKQTKNDFVIRHFTYKDDTVTVFGCDWLARDPDNPDCFSYHNFTLEALGKDCVVTRVPRKQLHKDGPYKCQLVPPDDDLPFTRCLVLHSDDAEDPPTTISDQPQPSDPTDDAEDPPTTISDQPQPSDPTGTESEKNQGSPLLPPANGTES